MTTVVQFTINGHPYEVSPEMVPVDTSLNSFIRRQAQLSGTKFMCLEGGCGACIVNVAGPHPVTRKRVSFAVNSCLFSVFSCHGLDVVTVEGLGSKTTGYHPVQERLAQFNGTQCGYCSPGMVMTMYGLLESKGGKVTMDEVESSLGGNICRCTGYRPILDAFKSFAVDASERLVQSCGDIEDLGRRCAGSCGSRCSLKSVDLGVRDGREWYRVRTVDEIFEVMDKIGDKPYMLVAGNTGHGVYRRREDLQVFIDVRAVEELQSFWIGGNLIVGANVTLTEFMDILDQAAKEDRRYSYCSQVAKHIAMIAHVAVRNVGTIAGNLALKNQHPEFPSDLYLLLESIGAELTIVDEDGAIATLSPELFIGHDMHRRLLLNVALPSLDPDTSVFRSFKIQPRAQNSKAYVNAAFLVRFGTNRSTVDSATLCFGGINPTFTHATETERFLTGQNLFNNVVLQEAFECLSHELHPNVQPPEPSPDYRRQVAIGLLYRFVLNIAPRDRKVAAPIYRSGGTPLVRSLSTGTQSFDTYPKNWPLTQNIPKLDAVVQTAGEARYVNDLPYMAGELHAAFVLATAPHCRILAIDASEALRHPAVVAFYSAKDIPGQNDFIPFKTNVNYGFNIGTASEEILCSELVLYHGQPLGIIVAETFEMASKASKLVRVSYGIRERRVLPTYDDVRLAGATERTRTQPFGETGPKYGRLGTGAVQITGKLTLNRQYHYTMEPHSCVCIPTEDGLQVHSSTQVSHMVQGAISKSLGLPMHKIDVIVRRVGGSFGSKVTRSALLGSACALAAHLTHRPVRMVATMETNMSTFGKRIAAYAEYEVNAERSGKIVRLRNVCTQDQGCSYNEPVGFFTVQAFRNCYDTGAWKLEMKESLSDTASNTWFRSPGSAEGFSMIETIMDHVAFATGRDPLAVRMQNISKGHKVGELLPQFCKDVEYESRKQAVDNFNGANRWKKRGISVVPIGHVVDYYTGINAWIAIHHIDGSVSITLGAIEMGQGVNTKAAQTAAHLLGIPLDKISVKPHSTATSPNAFISGGTTASDMACYSVKRACETLLARIRPVWEDNRTASWEAMIQTCFARNINLTASHYSKASEVQGYVVWAFCCTELEVDVLTGAVQLLRVDILEDTGESTSPLIDIGQIEGAFIMSVGYFLSEVLHYDAESGALLNNRSWNYKPPGARDIPIDFRVRLLQKSSNPLGVLRSKNTGEPAYNLGIVVVLALRYALNSARTDAGLPREWIELGAPTTMDKVLALTGNTIDQFVLH